MSGNDQMTDGAELRELRDSLSGVAMSERPRLETITARGRARRRRRLSAVAGLSVAGAAAGTALALGLTGVLGPARTPGTIRTASFTLASNSNGTATLTINPKELLDPAALQSDLAQYGIPAKVTSGSFCSSDPHPAGFSQVVSMHRRGRVPRRRNRVCSPPSRSTRRPCPRAPSSASATSSSARASTRASSRPTSCSSTRTPTPAPAPRLTPTAHPPATGNPTASGCCTAAPARPGRDPPRAKMARSRSGTPTRPGAGQVLTRGISRVSPVIHISTSTLVHSRTASDQRIHRNHPQLYAQGTTLTPPGLA